MLGALNPNDAGFFKMAAVACQKWTRLASMLPSGVSFLVCWGGRASRDTCRNPKINKVGNAIGTYNMYFLSSDPGGHDPLDLRGGSVGSPRGVLVVNVLPFVFTLGIVLGDGVGFVRELVARVRLGFVPLAFLAPHATDRQQDRVGDLVMLLASPLRRVRERQAKEPPKGSLLPRPAHPRPVRGSQPDLP